MRRFRCLICGGPVDWICVSVMIMTVVGAAVGVWGVGYLLGYLPTPGEVLTR